MGWSCRISCRVFSIMHHFLWYHRRASSRDVYQFMHIAVVGAGPAGTWVSALLARRGHSVTLLDPQAPWEKPCGGGVTAKAISGFGIFDSDLPRNNIERVTIFFADKDSVTV